MNRETRRKLRPTRFEVAFLAGGCVAGPLLGAGVSMMVDAQAVWPGVFTSTAFTIIVAALVYGSGPHGS
jgi:hypothetical protein